MVRGSGFWKTLIKAVAVGEVIIFLGSYRVWHQMNTSRDYRKWMSDKFPTILEGFYKAAEIGGYVGAREADAEAWSKHTTDAKT
ncbi:PREDICTED: protein CEBPZOS-like [Acropora digitifera]|nr:PREDICTED: protein CEBPZOS-like [Acropora digitifera]